MKTRGKTSCRTSNTPEPSDGAEACSQCGRVRRSCASQRQGWGVCGASGYESRAVTGWSSRFHNSSLAPGEGQGSRGKVRSHVDSLPWDTWSLRPTAHGGDRPRQALVDYSRGRANGTCQRLNVEAEGRGGPQDNQYRTSAGTTPRMSRLFTEMAKDQGNKEKLALFSPC